MAYFSYMSTIVRRRTRTLALIGCAVLSSNLGLPFAMAQQRPTLKQLGKEASTVSRSSTEQSGAPRFSSIAQTKDAYILGPGDVLVVELLDVPEYSGVFTINPDGSLYLPRLRSLSVEGMTVEELRDFLNQQFSRYVQDPQLFVSPVGFRPIRVYIGGEVQRPGYYYLSGQNGMVGDRSESSAKQSINLAYNQQGIPKAAFDPRPQIGGVSANLGLRLPTVFDAIRTAGGVTSYSKLSEVSVTRKRPLSSGGGKMRTELNFLELITEGNETQNIRLFDGDSVVVGRSPVELREQIIKAGQTNLSPDFVQVFVTGRVREPGSKVLPQGASLDQALAAAGGQKVVRGKLEFIRFNRDGTTDRRKFFAQTVSPAGSYKNPILMAGDVIRVNDSPLSATLNVFNEITAPALGIYSVYNLIRDIK